MSSRNQRQFLQLSIATLILIQFFYFLPILSNSMRSNMKVGSAASVSVRYELAITAVNDKPLSTPMKLSEDWRALGIEEYHQLQLLVDNLARALSDEDLTEAQAIYAEIEKEHIADLEKFSFEIQHIQTKRSASRASGSLKSNIINLWSSDLLESSS
ncbi:MAG: hypothetical protein AAGD96_30485 [Chloroflexota bacterium]